jgi:hypothetical protein
VLSRTVVCLVGRASITSTGVLTVPRVVSIRALNQQATQKQQLGWHSSNELGLDGGFDGVTVAGQRRAQWTPACGVERYAKFARVEPQEQCCPHRQFTQGVVQVLRDFLVWADYYTDGFE